MELVHLDILELRAWLDQNKQPSRDSLPLLRTERDMKKEVPGRRAGNRLRNATSGPAQCEEAKS
jgi:hypothetical protein